MSFSYPPPIVIGGGGGSGGSSINTSDSSIVLTSDEVSGESTATISTSNTPAIVVDSTQNVLIGAASTASIYRLVVVAPTSNCLELTNNPYNKKASFSVSADGTLSITTSGSNINLTNNLIQLDDGALYIEGVQVLATAAELNYLKITRGIASPDKALVVDSNKNISGINSLSATSLTGTLQTGAQPNITSLGTINITSTLSLGGTLVSSTATELNYVHVTPGSATASKALVVDSSKSITGINNLSATTLGGTLQTASQPNITSIGTLSMLNVSGRLGVGTTTPATDIEVYSATNPIFKLNNGTAASMITIDNGGNLRLNSDGNIIIQNGCNLTLGGSGVISGAVRVSATYLNGTIETASQPNITSIGTLSNLLVSTSIGLGTNTPNKKMEIFDSDGSCLRLSKSISAYADLTINDSGDLIISPVGVVRLSSGTSLRFSSGSITGVDSLTATNLTGTLQTASQPNITSIGTLTNLTVSGGIICYSLVATNITGTLQTADQPNITSIGTLSNLTVSNGISCSSITATSITGTLQTANQLNITTVGTLTRLAVANEITCASLTADDLTGTLLTAAQPNITSIGVLTNLTINNTLTASTVNATNLTGTIQTASQPNITTIGTLSNLTVSNQINCATLAATSLTGTLQTAAQPNITSVGTLGSLSITNGINCASISATSLTGTIQTASQPNITAVGTLSNVLTSGKIGINTTDLTYDINIASTDGNAIVIGYNESTVSISASSSGDIVLTTDSQRLVLANNTSLRFMGTGGISGLTSFSATEITGTLMTAAQPNITSLGMLDYVESGSIRLGPAHESIYAISVNYASGRLLSMTDGTIIITHQTIEGEYVINSSTGRVALALNVDLVLNGGTIVGLTELTVGGSTVTGSQLALLANVSEGTVSASSLLAADINSSLVGFNNLGATTLTLGTTILTESQLALLANVSTGTVIANSLLAADIDSNLVGFNNLGATTLTLGTSTLTESQLSLLSNVSEGTVVASSLLAADIDSNLVGFNNLGATTITVGGNIINGTQAALLANVSEGTVVASSLLAADSNLNLSGFNQLSASELFGTIATNAQPNITSVGTLDSLNVANSVGINTLSPAKQLEVNSTTGNCMRLTYDKTTSASNYADMIVSASGNLSIISSGGTTTIDQVVSNKLILGNTSNSTVPLEIGYVPFVMTSAYAYNTSTNAHGTIAAGGTTSYNYSVRAQGRILCSQSVDITSDRRVKTNIQELSDAYCNRFIEETTPVSFNLNTGDNAISYGYIAQDLLRHGFDELVNLDHDESMEEEIDEDGLISPQGVKFTVSYQHIIPILAKTQKRLMQENAELKQSVEQLLQLVQSLMK